MKSDEQMKLSQNRWSNNLSSEHFLFNLTKNSYIHFNIFFLLNLVEPRLKFSKWKNRKLSVCFFFCEFNLINWMQFVNVRLIFVVVDISI